MNCNNCGTMFRPTVEGIVITSDGKTAAGICHECCKDVRVAKIALRRPDIGSFAYEQWAPVEMMGGGLTSPKRAG